MTDPDHRAQPSLPPALDRVRKDHLVQHLLCDDLEALADGLPALPAATAIHQLCARIDQVSATHFARAEQAFNALPLPARPEQGALATLHQMHQMDEVHAQDLVSALQHYALGQRQQDVGQLAYMLRCYFDACRRAIALKESWIANAGFRLH